MKNPNRLVLITILISCLHALPLFAQMTPCDNADMTARSARYNEASLNSAIQAFNEHFALDDQGTDIEAISDTIAKERLEGELDRLKQQGITVDAIRVRYGLNGSRFVAVLQFMQFDPRRVYAVPVGSYYIANKGALNEIDEELAETYMFNYIGRVKIKRTTGPDWDNVHTTGAFPDPRTEWFQFPLKLNALMDETPEGTYLVLQCISEQACYGALPITKESAKAVGEGEEFRHMIAWYMLDKDKVKLVSAAALGTPIEGKYFRNRAVDLGHLCPPRCK